MATSFTSSPSQSLASWLGGPSDDTRGAANFEFEGIYIHPSHLEGSPDSSTSSSVLGYMSEEDDFPAVEKLALSSSSFTPEALPSPTTFWSRNNESFSSNGSDYFSYHNSSATSSSSSSSASSTPTCASSKATPLSRSSSRPPSFHADPSFDPSNALAGYSSRNGTTKENGGSASATLPHLASFPSPSSSSRGNPYSRRSSPSSASSNSGASMMRSVSTPVETQRQLDQRKSALSAVAAQMDEQAVKLVRSRSSVGLVGLDSNEGSKRERSSPMEASSSMGLGLAMSRPFPLPHAPFGASWGSALPLREEQTIPLVPFPYNLVHRISSTRLARSQSVTNMEEARYPLARTDSQPAMALSASVTMTRPRRTTLLSPMTPLFPSPSPTLVERMEDVVESPPRPSKVKRGMSY